MDQMLKEKGEFLIQGKAGTHKHSHTHRGWEESPPQRNGFGAGHGVNEDYSS